MMRATRLSVLVRATRKCFREKRSQFLLTGAGFLTYYVLLLRCDPSGPVTCHLVSGQHRKCSAANSRRSPSLHHHLPGHLRFIQVVLDLKWQLLRLVRLKFEIVNFSRQDVQHRILLFD
jgi:hypothetical protein